MKENQNDNNIATLNINIPAIPSTCSVHDAGELLFLSDKYQGCLSLPIVENNKPVGVVSRYELTKIYVKQFGRELYGKQPIRNFMNANPLIVDENLSYVGCCSTLLNHRIKKRERC